MSKKESRPHTPTPRMPVSDASTRATAPERNVILLPSQRLANQVRRLAPDRGGEFVLTIDTDVLCCNRGRQVLHDMWDSTPYKIHPGYFSVAYGAAKHFQGRAVVPGSRNPETRTSRSFISIIAPVTMVTQLADGSFAIADENRKFLIDAEDTWEPFTDDEVRAYDGALEALDRKSMVDPIVPDVRFQTIYGERLPLPGRGTEIIAPQGVLAKDYVEDVRNASGQVIGQRTVPGRAPNEAVSQIAADRAAAAAEAGG